MHATIAGLSSGVPTAAIAYSDKTLGVFETCGQGGQVADPRVLGTEEMIERIMDLWKRREAARSALAGAMPAVVDRAREQMRRIIEACGAGGGAERASKSCTKALSP
jgi:polysaccharide pyruvyl transferase WcaK-like protein